MWVSILWHAGVGDGVGVVVYEAGVSEAGARGASLVTAWRNG